MPATDASPSIVSPKGPPATRREMTLFEHADLDRVSSRIARAILDFVSQRDAFRGDELLAHVEREVGHVAPGSPDRILRMLRKRGRVDYRVTNRRESAYEVVSPRPSDRLLPR
jgi:hypothetical protein